MSVLSRPQGSPERVWSLVAGLSALNGSCDRMELEALLNPGFVKDELDVKVNLALADDSLGAATSLGLIRLEDQFARLGFDLVTVDFSLFADHVHEQLCTWDSSHADSVILEMFAWTVAESDRQGGIAWLYEWSREAYADRANAALFSDGEVGHKMNSTKVPAWRRWIAFLGLSVRMPQKGVPDFPLPSARILREVDRSKCLDSATLKAADFTKILAQRLPYLDGGRLFNQASARIGHVSRSLGLSPLFSMALRDLHDRGDIILHLSGDSSDKISLAPDSDHPVAAFDSVSRGATAR
jgi:hypothetical protein